MMTRERVDGRSQIEIISLDDMVPSDHLVRKLEAAIDWRFIYDMVEPLYCGDNGRPSLDPVTLIKLPILQYMFGIRSMRQTVAEAEVNMAYRWFLGLGLQDKVPHFSTFSKNYTRRFKDTDLFEQIFQHILKECMDAGLVDPSVLFVDSTHVKARANGKKYRDEPAEDQALWFAEELKKEIQRDREAHGKKPLKELEITDDEMVEEVTEEEGDENDEDEDNENNDKPSGAGKPNKNTSKKKAARRKKEKHRKVSRSDPESGWFRKGEHKHVFAYSVQTACDHHGIVMGYSVNPGNENDGRTFKSLMDKLECFPVGLIVGDTAYKTPAIAKYLHDKGIGLLSTYSRPKTKEGFFGKKDFVYDEYNDCYICPENQILSYRTTNRHGYQEFKSDGKVCANCPSRGKCTQNKKCEKLVTRHVWQAELEEAENNRYEDGVKDWYPVRKETIERLFADSKEYHSFRYTQMFGKARMEMKSALTFACQNLKKLANVRWGSPTFAALFHSFFPNLRQNPTFAAA